MPRSDCRPAFTNLPLLRQPDGHCERPRHRRAPFRLAACLALLPLAAAVQAATPAVPTTLLVDVAGGATTTPSTPISGAVLLQKTGDGLLVLPGANNYTGGTLLQGGLVQPRDNAALGTGSISFDGGGLQYDVTVAGYFATQFAATPGQRYWLDVTANQGSAAFDVAMTSVGGSLRKTGGGTLVLQGTNTFSGLTTIEAGILALGTNPTATSNGTLAGDVINNATLRVSRSNYTFSHVISGTGSVEQSRPATTLTLTGNNTYTGDTKIIFGTISLGNGGTSGSVQSGSIQLINASTARLIFNRSDSITYGGVISGPGALNINGSGTVTLTGVNTMSGATTVSAGTLVVDGGLAASRLTVASGATLGGHGRVGAVTLRGWVAPGNFPGTLNAGNTSFQAGSGYVWEINDASGTAGSAWDLLSITGTLTLAATSASPFTVQLHTLEASDAAGLAAHFDGRASHRFTLVSTTTGITGFDAAAFSIDASAFNNATYGGTWAVEQNGNNLDLVFTAAVPEPQAQALLLAGLGVLALMTRRRRTP